MSLIIINQEKQIAVVQLNRPQKLNALSRELLNELRGVFMQLATVNDLRVVILTATGDKTFCAGTDIAELVAAEAMDVARRGLEVCELINRFPVPVIAAINGLAAGGGCELALACHLRIAASHAMFSLPETKLGLIPGYGGTQRLAREIGAGPAVEMMLTGKQLSADEAKLLGLVNQVVAADELLAQSRSMSAEISGLAPLAVRACLRAVVDGQELTLNEGLALETKLFAQLFETKDMREGTRAFLEKRPPKFNGN